MPSAHDIVPKLNDLQDAIVNLSHNHEITDTGLRHTSKPMPPGYLTFSGDTHEDGKAIVNKINRFSSYNGLSEADKCNIFPMGVKKQGLTLVR